MKFPDRRRALRQRTAAAHEALEAQVGGLADRLSYSRYCRGLHAFRANAEALLSPFASYQVCGDWRPVAIAEELAADLQDLGAPPHQGIGFGLVSTDEAIGGFYVLEGSALGARLLVKQAEALGFTSAFGARHLARQAATLDNWRAFLDLLESLPHLDIDIAIRGANLTFEAAADAMTGARRDG